MTVAGSLDGVGRRVVESLTRDGVAIVSFDQLIGDRELWAGLEAELFPCTSCREQGVIQTESVVRVPIPPLARPGSIVEVPLDGLGIHNLYLRLHVRVGSARF